MLLKLAVCAQPKRLLEIGSFRGYTSLSLAQHTAEDAHLVTVDRFPEHGEAYRNTPWATKIERRVGEMNFSQFIGDELASYDLIFVDADHAYAGVRRDTEIILPLVSPPGFVVWHDYANWGYFDGKNGVPEYLRELSASLPIAHVIGSDLAIYSPAWRTAGPARAAYERALVKENENGVGVDPWRSGAVRG